MKDLIELINRSKYGECYSERHGTIYHLKHD